MSRTLHHLMLVSGIALLFGCTDGQGPEASVALRTDSLEVTLPTPQQAAKAISILLMNEGPAPVTVRMCNNAGFPGANLTLEMRDSTGAFIQFTGFWITCNDAADGFDLTIPAGQEKPINRLLAAPEAGEFRYKLVYITSDGKSAVTTSNVFVVHPAP
jgi:hypothetical protein